MKERASYLEMEPEMMSTQSPPGPHLRQQQQQVWALELFCLHPTLAPGCHLSFLKPLSHSRGSEVLVPLAFRPM